MAKAQGPDALPAAGDARREVLRRRTDELDEAGETRAAQTETHAIDPNKLRPINEIQSHINDFNELEVSGALPDYVYLWENRDSNSGMAVRARLTIRIREGSFMQPCWEIVKGDMPEADELRFVDGTRKLGDCILMRCRVDRYRALTKQRNAVTRARHQLALDPDAPALEEIAHDLDPQGKYIRSVRPITNDDPTVRQHLAQALADRQFDQRLRDGTVGAQE